MPSVVRESRLNENDREFLGLPALRCDGCGCPCEHTFCGHCQRDLAAPAFRPAKRRNGRPIEEDVYSFDDDGRDAMED